MAYFKVVIKEEFVYEVLVRANTMDDAKKDVLSSNIEWGDHIYVQAHVYEAVELEEKK
jgi:hypothetical protein